MSTHAIPSEINDEAARQGFNSVEYAGCLDGSEYYSVACVSADGTPLPIGLPTFIKDDNGELSVISGLDGLDLCSRFY